METEAIGVEVHKNTTGMDGRETGGTPKVKEDSGVEVCKDTTEMDVSETESTLQGAGIQLLDQSGKETSRPAPPPKAPEAEIFNFRGAGIQLLNQNSEEPSKSVPPEQKIFKFRDARADSSRSDVTVTADDTQWVVLMEFQSKPEPETLRIPAQRLRFVCKNYEKCILIISVRDETQKGRFHNILLQYLDSHEAAKAQQFLQTFIKRYLIDATEDSTITSTGLKPYFLGNVQMDRRIHKKTEGQTDGEEADSMQIDSEEMSPPLQLQRLWCQIDEEALTLYDSPFSTMPRFWFFFYLTEAPHVVDHIAFQRKPPHSIKVYSHGETVEELMLTTIQQLEPLDGNYEVAKKLRYALKVIHPREGHVYSMENDPHQFIKAFSRDWCSTPDLSQLPKENTDFIYDDEFPEEAMIVRPKVRLPKPEQQATKLAKSMTGLLSNMPTIENKTRESVARKFAPPQIPRVSTTPHADALLSRYDPNYSSIPENLSFKWMMQQNELNQMKQLLDLPESSLESGGLDPNSDEHLHKSSDRIWEHFEREEFGEVLSNLTGLKKVFIESTNSTIRAVAELEEMILMKHIFFQAWKDGALRL